MNKADYIELWMKNNNLLAGNNFIILDEAGNNWANKYGTLNGTGVYYISNKDGYNLYERGVGEIGQDIFLDLLAGYLFVRKEVNNVITNTN